MPKSLLMPYMICVMSVRDRNNQVISIFSEIGMCFRTKKKRGAIKYKSKSKNKTHFAIVFQRGRSDAVKYHAIDAVPRGSWLLKKTNNSPSIPMPTIFESDKNERHCLKYLHHGTENSMPTDMNGDHKNMIAAYRAAFFTTT